MDSDSIVLELTADVVSAYVSNNIVPAVELPALIRSVHAALQSDSDPAEPEASRQPAVPIRRSLHDDYVVCLEDGLKFKSLKRHLHASHSLTPAEYREKWGLPASYPMVAKTYAANRSALAKKIGLGKTRKRRARR